MQRSGSYADRDSFLSEKEVLIVHSGGGETGSAD